MLYAICLGLFAPLVGFLILITSSHVIGRRLAGWIGCGTIFISFLCFASILILYNIHQMAPINLTLYSWIPISGINADFNLTVDPLALLMTMIITGVGFLIHVYSTGYMDHEEDFARYFACMNFFVFSMLLLVLAGNLVLLFVGWEGVGLASYLLIGYYYQRPAAAKAATKAFVVNRVGDFGFLVGLLLIFYTFGTGDIDTIISKAAQGFAVGAPVITVITLLLFFGATGKSAQLPLHTWLADAMEGPTPVSALIHAATMVTAGVYLLVRMHTVFMLAPTTLQVVGIIGAVTSLFASLCALGQTDLKRVLAYSTVSQLGLMFLACGAGAFYAAMFHLTSHAFMKSLLFLSAGNVVHMMDGETDMGKMGGLYKKFTKTHWFFLIGTLAMAGIPPFAAFFSKDLILEQEYLSGFEILFTIGLAASILTGAYLIRAYCLAFLGKPTPQNTLYDSIKEAPFIMIAPITLLAFLAMFGGFLGFNFGDGPILERFLSHIGMTPAEKELSKGFMLTPETWMAICGAFLGVIVAAIIYTRYVKDLGPTLQFLKKAFYVDEIYAAVFIYPLEKISRFIDKILEPAVFTRGITSSVHATQSIARWLQQFQSGQIRSYLAWMVVGMLLLIVYIVF